MAANIFENKWVDLIFTGRNKEYGAYVLRKKGDEYTIKGIVFAVVLFTAAISTPVIINYIQSKIPKENEVKVTDVNTLEQPPPIDKNEPPPPPPPPPPPLKSTVKFTPPEIKPDEEVPEDEPPPPQEEMKDKDAGAETVVGDPNGVDASLTDGGEGDGNAPEVLTFAEQMPEFPGGYEELYKFLQKNVNYPPQARDNGIEGKVMLTFVVATDGKISSIELAGNRKLGWGLEEEAVRVMKAMPPWTPGKQNGKPVTVKYTLPIKFQLQ
ncbi:MAG: energy transducer TonB [Bacteroidia bacterium]|nr:energy transducer TonB [Bacteroidia bacterium]